MIDNFFQYSIICHSLSTIQLAHLAAWLEFTYILYQFIISSLITWVREGTKRWDGVDVPKFAKTFTHKYS